MNISQLYQQAQFLTKDDKNLPILETLFKVHIDDISVAFAWKLMTESKNIGPETAKYLLALYDEKQNKACPPEETDDEEDPVIVESIVPSLESKLKDEVEELKDANSKLKDEVEELKDANTNIQERNEGLQAMVDELHSKVEILSEEIDELKDTNTRLQSSNDELKEENDKLKQTLLDSFADLLLNAREAVINKDLNQLVAKSLTHKAAAYLANDPNLTNEYMNSILFTLWSTNNEAVLSQIISREFFVIDKEIIDDMVAIFRHIVNNFIKLNSTNTKLLIISYLSNKRDVSTEQFKKYLEKVKFENLTDVLRDFYLEEANKKIAEFA